MIKKGSKVKGFRFHELNSANVDWTESKERFIGVEGTVKKIAEGPHGVGPRFEVRFPMYDREVRLATDLEKAILDRVAQIGALTDEEIRELKIDLVLE